MATMKHTPMPWFTDNVDVFGSKGEKVAHLKHNSDDGDFIVRAVNCHDELVAALQRSLQYIVVCHRDGKDQGLSKETLAIAEKDFEQAQAILAKATKGE